MAAALASDWPVTDHHRPLTVKLHLFSVGLARDGPALATANHYQVDRKSENQAACAEDKSAMIVITNDCSDSLTAAVSWAAAASKVCRPRHKYLIKSINMKCM